MAWRGTFGCWPCRLLSFYHRKVSFSLSGRVMSPGEVLFFPKLWNYWIYISSDTCAQSRYFWFFVIVATDVSLPGFMKQPFWFLVLLSLICFLITSVCLTHPITLRLSPLAPSPRCLSLFRSTLGALNILASSHFLFPLAHLSAGKIDLIKNEKDYLREVAA